MRGLIVAALLASVVASPCQANPQEMLTLMRRITALAQEGRYGEAVGLARKLATEAERTSGRQSVLTATTLVVLAQALQAQGELTEAERVLRRALAIREKALGANHPDVAAVLWHAWPNSAWSKPLERRRTRYVTCNQHQ